jgi:uncharacterized protein YndB with AHSA1/START domain
VFGAFSDPDELARWWGPAGFSTPSLEFHARVGERYRIAMRPPWGERFYLTGEFRAVDPLRRLAYTFAWEDPDPGCPQAGSVQDRGAQEPAPRWLD